MNISWPVENLDHKQLIAVPLIVGAIFGTVIALHWYNERSPVPLGLEFSSGSYIRIQNVEIPSETTLEKLKSAFEKQFESSAKIHTYRNEGSITIETSANLLEVQAKENIKTLLSETQITGTPQISIETMGSIITQKYKDQARNAAIATIIAMAIILFIALRDFPAIGGILSVIGLDFLGILGGMAILGIPLTLSSMAGILLIFGYAVNTNILLSTNILRRKGGTPRERASRAMNTGIKMSSTSAVAMIALNLMTKAPELKQISAILVIGILVDMLNTWLLNSGLLLRHKVGTEEKYHARI